jgi:hypothetical protein
MILFDRRIFFYKRKVCSYIRSIELLGCINSQRQTWSKILESLWLGAKIFQSFLGTMMNSPCTPCPSYTSLHMYSPLYFATHVHNVHCITVSQANMKVDRLFIHPKTAHIVHKTWTNCPSTLHLWHIVHSVFYILFFVTFCPSDCQPRNIHHIQCMAFWPHIFGPFWPIHSCPNSPLIPETFDPSQSQTFTKKDNPPPSTLSPWLYVYDSCAFRSPLVNF